MIEQPPASRETPLGSIERSDIESQLERLLQNSHFSHSRRFPTFLRFVVSSVLNGHADGLKERTIGIEVFGKDAAYETTADPIVRVTAAEIRKRIAQYYQEPGHENELRISLPPGSYVPQFHRANGHEAVATTALVATTPSSAEVAPAETAPASDVQSRSRFRPVSSLMIVVLVVLLAATCWWLWNRTHETALDRFWAPVLSSNEPVLFCIADQNQFSAIALRDAANPSQEHLLQDKLSAVVIDDVNPLVHIAGLMDAHGHLYHLRGEAATTLTDLRDGPTVFVGAFDNAWTLRLTNGLRYHFGNNADMTRFWIADQQSGDAPKWVLDRTQQEKTNNYRDYGIVARFKDGSTGKTSVIVAGIARGGTIAAGEFLTEPINLEALSARAPKGWEGKNIEVVISSEIIDGRSAAPKIEAVHFW
jgi:hypothetical protein